MVLDRRRADELGENAPVEPERAALFDGQALVRLAREVVDFVAEGAVEFVVGDRYAADLGDIALAIARKDALDAPDREGEHENSEKQLGDPTFGRHVVGPRA